MQIKARWQAPFGDRQHEIVIIGIDMDKESIIKGFDACLLTEEEISLGEASWKRLPDPFPEWRKAEEAEAVIT
jgi:hypothetical protein